MSMFSGPIPIAVTITPFVCGDVLIPLFKFKCTDVDEKCFKLFNISGTLNIVYNLF